MAGHSKWAQIKRKKAVTDARRGKLWTKILKEVTVAARIGGGDPSGNPRLRTAIQEAKNSNVPNDNIDRAVKRGSGDLDGVSYEEISYEGYGPGGSAFLVEAVTDNRNRTVAEVRHLLSKHGGNLGESGSVAWMFAKRGYIALDKTKLADEEVMELALELEVEDVASDEDVHELFTSAERYLEVRDGLEQRGIEVVGGEVAMLAQNYVELSVDQLDKALTLVAVLEDLDDVQNVWTNLDVSASAA